MDASPCVTTSLPAFGGVRVLGLGRWAKCVVAAHCFNLCFPGRQRDVEHHFMLSFAICVSLLSCLLSSLAYF